MMSGRNRFPFTPSQWQELEHQALIFKYMDSGIPIPPDLLFTIKRSCMVDTSLISSKLFPRQPHIGWSCFQMGLERKIDPEPGRCRRTDGKKWRCSKEAYPDSKYCERHMHRGKNRSRKPVEVIPSTQTTSNTTAMPVLTKNPSALLTTNPSNSNSLSFLSPETHHHHHHHHHSQNDNYLHYPNTTGYHALSNQFLSSHNSVSRPSAAAAAAGIGLSSDNSTHLIFDTDYRRSREVYGMKEEVGEHAFFSSEPSGSVRNLSAGSPLDDSTWQLSPLTMSSSSSSSSKQRSSTTSLHNEYSYLQLQSLNDRSNNNHVTKCGGGGTGTMKFERVGEEEPQKTVHRFFDEWPPKTNKDSWLDLEDKSSNTASVSTTRLSISIPSSHDFPIFNSRAHNDG